jgi:PX domain
MLFRDKHTSLKCPSVSHKEKEFYNVDDARSIQKRYSDFRNLHLSLQNSTSGFELPFPGKKMTGNLGKLTLISRFNCTAPVPLSKML